MIPDDIQNRNGKSPVAQAVVTKTSNFAIPLQKFEKNPDIRPHPRTSSEFHLHF